MRKKEQRYFVEVMTIRYEKLRLRQKQYKIAFLVFGRKPISAYFLKLGLTIQKSKVFAQKTNRLTLVMQEVENLVVTNTCMKMIVGMLFLTLSNVDMAFTERIYLEIVHCRQGLSNYKQAFIVHFPFSISKTLIHPAR